MAPNRATLLALCVVEDALYHCQYVGRIAQPAWGLRLALAYLFSIAGDDPGIAPKSRDAFDNLWRLVTGDRPLNGSEKAERNRSTLARTEYARIRRMVRVPQTIKTEAEIAKLCRSYRERSPKTKEFGEKRSQVDSQPTA